MEADDARAKAQLISRRSLSSMIVGGSAMSFLVHEQSAYAQGKVEASLHVEDLIKIERLIYQYAMALDDRDAAAFADCFAEGVLTRDLVDKTIEFHRMFEYTMHNVLNHLFTVRDGMATGSAYCIVSYVKKNNKDGKLTKFDTYSRYLGDQLVKQGDRWRFSRIRQWTPIFSTAEVSVEKDLPAYFRKDLKEVFER